MVGHSISNDFEVLKFKHPRNLTRDIATAPYAKVRAGLPPKGPVALRRLAYKLLGLKIQGGEHSSVEDAQATMAIYRLVEKEWEEDLKKQGAGKMKKRKSKGAKAVCDQTISDEALLSNDIYWQDTNQDNCIQ